MTGKYLIPIENKKHCIAVDCDRHLIMESELIIPKENDIDFRLPFPLHLEYFKLFNVVDRDLTKLYRVIKK